MNDDEQLELDIPEEPLTEEGLKEDIKRNEKRRQEEYDEATKGNEELRRRQARRGRGGETQLDIPGLFEAGSGLRTSLAIGTEVGLNTILDIFSFEPTSQVAGGAFINYLAQRIRGGEISKGEMAAAGLASLIPGGAQGKALTKLAKSTGKGAVSGGIEVTGQKIVDEGRLPTAGELGTGLAVGGAFGGIFQTAADSKFLKALGKRVNNPLDNAITVYAASPTKVKKLQPGVFIDPIDGDEFGTYLSDTEVFKTIRRWRSYKPPAAEVNRVRRTLLKFGMVGNRFDMNIYKKAVKRDPVTKTKRFTANEERDLISIFVTAPITKVNYNQVSKRVMPQFRKQYGPMLNALGLNPSELQLHHLLPLKASLPLYHGLVYDSDEWWELTAFLLKRHIKAGDSETNLRKLIGGGKRSAPSPTATIANPARPLKTPHSISHQHVRDEFGEDGSKFFTQDVLDSIENDQKERIRIADLYTKRMRRNFDLTNQAQKVYEMTFDPKNKYAMEDIVSTMSRMDQDGYFDLTNKKYQVDILNDMIINIRKEGGGNEYLRNRDIITEKEYNLRQGALKEQRESINESIDYAQEYAEDVAERAKKRDNIFTRYSTLEDAIDEAERILERDRLFYSDPALPGIQNYEQTVLRLARLLMENPNYIP